MALETVVYPQDQFGYGSKEYFYNLIEGGVWHYDHFGNLQEEEDKADLVGVLANMEHAGLNNGNNLDSSSSSAMQNVKEWDPNSSPEPPVAAATSGRRKRRRTKSCKNKEELENQRMTHITVERNRRKQMNEYLSVIRSLMPSSYVQRGDQASIIGGAINFVKELEQHLQTLEAHKRNDDQVHPNINNDFFSPLFANFFAFPQYSTRSVHDHKNSPATMANEAVSESPSALADIEVTMVESHANLKILSKKRPRQLLKMVAGLQCLRLTVLHLNVTTVDQMVLYSLNVRVEDGCQLNTVDEIADAVNHLLGRIQEEAVLFLEP
ncbi:transcription factor bHLH94-like [Cornus florida]|uniref:transcription factor bHLH94-like n=1 Tax=Cornus florida TaxID=4283 RepID=UPI0028983421|nr:transcription factor bHLH94-like [Cornus florida]